MFLSIYTLYVCQLPIDFIIIIIIIFTCEIIIIFLTGSAEQLENTELSNGIVQDDPEIIVQSTEKIDVLFNRIKIATVDAANIYGDVLCQLTTDLVPPKEILTKVIKELLTLSQPHCEVIAKILFQVSYIKCSFPCPCRLCNIAFNGIVVRPRCGEPHFLINPLDRFDFFLFAIFAMFFIFNHSLHTNNSLALIRPYTHCILISLIGVYNVPIEPL